MLSLPPAVDLTSLILRIDFTAVTGQPHAWIAPRGSLS